MAKPLMWGDATLDADRIESIRAVTTDWDHSYLPGYSEARRENDLRVKRGERALPLPKFQWVRVGHVDATNVGNKDMFEWAMLGFQFATESDLKQYGYSMPPTAHVDAAGRIRREDVALALVSPEQHRANVLMQRDKNIEFHSGSPSVGRNGAPIEVTEHTNRRLNDLADVANYSTEES